MNKATPSILRNGALSAQASAYLLLCATALFWAGNMVVARAMRHDISPIAMAFYRWLIAGLILTPFVLSELRDKLPVIRRASKVLFVLGLIGVSTFNTISYAAMRHTSANTGALFNSTVPIWILLLSWLVLREPMALRQALGVIVSMLGVVLIVTRGALATITTLSFNAGDLWLLGAMAMWAVYTLLLRWKPAELSTPGFLACIIMFGLPLLAAAYAIELAWGRRFDLNLQTAATLAYYGVFPSVLAYLFFNRGVEVLGAARAGVFVHLVPVFGFVLSALFLDEPPQWFHFTGIALVFCGIWLCNAVRTVPVRAGSEL